MKPTDQQIEEAVAKVLGWSQLTPDRNGYLDKPWKYCTDRNLLPQLWAYLEGDNLETEFQREFILIMPATFDVLQWFMQASPRAHCEEFLKAVSAWPDEWE